MDLIILLWFFLFEGSNTGLFPPEVFQDGSNHAAGLALGAMTSRASGFGIFDSSALHHPTLILIDVWMFIGGAPVSTCAGIKVTAVAVLILAVVAEFRGREDIQAFGKRLPANTLKVAVTVFICGLVTVISFTLFLSLCYPNAPVDSVIFDVISAFANCGLSLGLSAHLTSPGLVLLGILMFLGRLGIMTVVAALIKQERVKLIRYPQENLLLG
jgi:Trk-type K+ transport system membrane component